MWARQSHLLKLLTAPTSDKFKFIWSGIELKSFEEIKRIATHDTLLSYHDFNKRFDIHTDDSYCEIGSLIIQEVKPVAFYSRNLTGPKYGTQ